MKNYQSIKTNSQKWDGILIRKEQEDVAAVIYQHNIPDEMDERTLEEIVEELVIEYFKGISECPQVDVNEMTKEQLLRRIMPQAVSRERNVELLKGAPHKEFLDIAILYRYVLEEGSDDGILSFVITNNIAKKWDVSLQEMDMAAKQYAKQQKYSFECIDDQTQLYVITNKKRIYGASVLAESKMLRKLAHKLQADLLAIPSSVHEVLAIPAAEDDDINFLRYFVAAVNQQMKPEEILGTSVYRYRRDRGILEIA